MTTAAIPDAIYRPGCRMVPWHLQRLLTWVVAGVPPNGRRHQPRVPDPAQNDEPQEPVESVPGTGISLIAIYMCNAHARQVVAGFAAATPSLDTLWQQLDQALSDVPLLGAAVARLTAELAGARLDQANLIAAIQAALAAHADGDTDALSYLRDEMASHQAHRGLSEGDRDDA